MKAKEQICLVPITNAEAQSIADGEISLSAQGGVKITPEMESACREIIKIIDTETPGKDKGTWDRVSYNNGFIRGLYVSLDIIHKYYGITTKEK
jgi:hypothetical protein